MKHRRLVIFLIILAFITVLIVLNSTLFTLQSISINWLTTKYQLENISDISITAGIKKGDSIFLVKKDNISEELEKKYPYLRVVSIETKFPNKIVIHSAERESLYAIKLGDNNYVITDELGKVLTYSNSSIFAVSELGVTPIRVEFNNITLNESKFVVGELIQDTGILELLSKLAITLRESNYSPTTSKGIFTSISIVSIGENVEISMQTRSGMVIELKDALKLTTDKFLLGLSQYNYFHGQGVVEGTLEVWFSEAINKVVCRYI